ncbi:MAG: hypothetical protein NC548_38215 [Lachnospiraceae bacterium]|nr:hypothetical protein [Lachnospiraceae bacterium]
MERIRLSATEKTILRLLSRHGEESLDTISPCQVYRALCSLESKDMIHVAWIEGCDYEAVQITRNGKAYLIENPGLHNPIDWAKVGAIAAVGTLLVGIAALFVACTKIL